MGGGGSVGFDSGQVVTLAVLSMDLAATVGPGLLSWVIVLTEFGWQFAVGFLQL